MKLGANGTGALTVSAGTATLNNVSIETMFAVTHTLTRTGGTFPSGALSYGGTYTGNAAVYP